MQLNLHLREKLNSDTLLKKTRLNFMFPIRESVSGWNISQISLNLSTRLRAAAQKGMKAPVWDYQSRRLILNCWVVKYGLLRSPARDRYFVLIYPDPAKILTGPDTLYKY